MAAQGARSRDSFCRPCRAEYKRKHYLANRERYIGNAHATKRRLRFERTEFLIDCFATHPCFDCGEVDPVAIGSITCMTKSSPSERISAGGRGSRFSPRLRSAKWSARIATVGAQLDAEGQSARS